MIGEVLVEEAVQDGVVDLREPMGNPEVSRRVGRRMAEAIRKKGYTQVVGEGLGAYPVVGAITAEGLRGGMIRKHRKGYDRNRLVEGPIDKSKPAVLVEDLANSGRGLRLALRKCTEDGVRVAGAQAVVVLGDDESVIEKMKDCGLWFDALFHL